MLERAIFDCFYIFGEYYIDNLKVIIKTGFLKLPISLIKKFLKKLKNYMLKINKHWIVLFNLINQIYKSDLSRFLGFKGGTMAYFFYDLDRFSVNLDFDFLDEEKNQFC